MPPDTGGPMKNKTDFFIALALLVICAVAWQQIRLLPESASAEFFRPASFPTGVTVLLAVLACILLVRSFLVRGRAAWPERPVLLKVLLMILLVLGYVAGFVGHGEYAYDALWPGGTGFCSATLIFLVLAQVLTGCRGPWRILLIAGLMTAFLYLVFALLFNVPLP